MGGTQRLKQGLDHCQQVTIPRVLVVHLGLENPRRRPSLRPAMPPPWPAAVLWLPQPTDGTSALKSRLSRPSLRPAMPAFTHAAQPLGSIARAAVQLRPSNELQPLDTVASHHCCCRFFFHVILVSTLLAICFFQHQVLQNTEAIAMIPKQLQTSRLQLSKDITYLEDRRVTFIALKLPPRFYPLPPSRCLPVSTARL